MALVRSVSSLRDGSVSISGLKPLHWILVLGRALVLVLVEEAEVAHLLAFLDVLFSDGLILIQAIEDVVPHACVEQDWLLSHKASDKARAHRNSKAAT